MDKKTELLAQLRQHVAEHPTKKVRTPADIAADYVARFGEKKVEHFFVTSLDGANAVIRTRIVSRGLVNRTLVHPREVFRGAIVDNAVAIIVGHNHPSGSLVISSEDREVTRSLEHAAKIIGIPVLDHIVVSKNGFISLKETM